MNRIEDSNQPKPIGNNQPAKPNVVQNRAHKVQQQQRAVFATFNNAGVRTKEHQFAIQHEPRIDAKKIIEPSNTTYFK